MVRKQKRSRRSRFVRSTMIAAAIACCGTATSAYASGDGSDDSVIDLIIDWIEDLIDPEPPVEEPPADDDSW